jgi:glyoxylase-like metal-dependent hydrolase (beta-lactamase superfamily II)
VALGQAGFVFSGAHTLAAGSKVWMRGRTWREQEVSRGTPPAGVFPEEMTQGVYRLGYNAKSSYGSHSFLIRRPDGNAMVDAPRWTKQVVSALEEAGGLSDILLTHKDDVADADRYAKHFGARVSIHKADRSAARYATQIFEGRDPIQVYNDLLVIPVPGHTKGSVVYLWKDRCLFTGDSLSWSFAENDLEAFRDFCWYSWDEQRRLAGPVAQLQL